MNPINILNGLTGGNGSKTTFSQLNGQADFSAFQFQTGAVCYATGPPAQGILDGTVPRPVVIAPQLDGQNAVINQAAIDARQQEIANWDDKNTKLYYYLALNVGPKIRPLIAMYPPGATTEVWNRLMRHFQGNSLTDTTQNVSKLVRSRMAGDLLTFVDSVNQFGRILDANIAALEARNVLARQAGRHEHSFVEILQIAVFLGGLPPYFSPCVENLWVSLDLCYENAVAHVTDFNERYLSNPANAAKARQAEALRVQFDEARAAMEARAIEDITSVSLKPSGSLGIPKIIVGTNSRTGENVHMLCTHCNRNGHMADMCFVLHPELRVAAKATRQANKQQAINKRDTSAAARLAEATSETATADLPWSPFSGFTGTFGGYHARVSDGQPGVCALPDISFEADSDTEEVVTSDSVDVQELLPSQPSHSMFWALVDSGATYNYCNSLQAMHDYKEFGEPERVRLADGSYTEGLGLGMVGIFPFMYVPALEVCLLSVSFMATLDVTFSFSSDDGLMHHSAETDLVYSMMHRSKGLYYVALHVRCPEVPGGSVPTSVAGEGAPPLTADYGVAAFLAVASAEAAEAAVGLPANGCVRFVVDSGATNNFVNSLHGVESLDPSAVTQVRIANGSVLESSGRGLLNGSLPVVYMPGFVNNLGSVSAFADFGMGFRLGKTDSVMFREGTNEVMAPVHRVGMTYYVDIPVTAAAEAASALAKHFAHHRQLPVSDPGRKVHRTTIQYLHEIFHTSHGRLMEAINDKHFCGFELPSPLAQGDCHFDCVACALSKTNQPPRISQDVHKRASAPYERVFIDSEVARLPSWSGHMVALVIVDDYSNASHVLTCHSRDGQVALLEDFLSQRVPGLGFTNKIVSCSTRNIRSDNAGEFSGESYNSMLTRMKAHAEYTQPHTPQQNGRVERKIQDIVKSARAFILATELPQEAWAEMMMAASYLNNLLPTTVNPEHKSPMEMLTGKPVDIRWLHPIGTLCAVHHNGPRKPNVSKFDPNSTKGILVGYAADRRLYRVCTSITNGTVVESDKVVFFDKPQALVSLRTPIIGGGQPSYEPDYLFQEGSPPSRPQALPAVPPAPPGPAAPAVAPVAGPPAVAPVVGPHGPANINPPAQTSKVSGRAIRKPARFRAECDFAEEWARAAKIPYNVAEKDPRLVSSMTKELEHLIESNAIQLAPLPPGRKAVGVTWAHKFKHDEHNQPTYAKSRICPQGFSQVPGVDFNVDEVAAPAVNMCSVFIMLAITVHLNMDSALFDVDAAFTIPPLKEEVYMKIPQGMEKVPGHALLLNTSLNGLKQSAFNWNNMAAGFITSQGFEASVVDPCLYFRSQDGKFAMLALYVDDFRTAFECLEQRAVFEANMRKKFPIKKLSGEFYLGMQVVHDKVAGTISISHGAYITNMLARFNMTDCKPVSTPAAPGTKLEKSVPGGNSDKPPAGPEGEPEDGEAVAFIPHYRAAVGALLWLARTSKPEILYAVNQCAAHCKAPNTTHVTAVKRILRYCKGTINECLVLHRGQGIELVAYSDSDYAGEPELSDAPMKSLSGLVVGLQGIGFLYAQSSLQTTVSRSTAEAEYRAGGTACQIVLGIRNQLEELGFKQEWPTTIWGDNEACVRMFKSAVSGSSLRHIKIDHHFVRDHVLSQEVQMLHIATERMIADIMTKALARAIFKQHADAIRAGKF